jgi:hypothetical protein
MNVLNTKLNSIVFNNHNRNIFIRNLMNNNQSLRVYLNYNNQSNVNNQYITQRFFSRKKCQVVNPRSSSKLKERFDTHLKGIYLIYQFIY